MSDDLFAEVTIAAKVAGPSRNEFCVRAIGEHLERIRDAAIIDQLNAIYDEIDQEPNPFFQAAALALFQRASADEKPSNANFPLNRDQEIAVGSRLYERSETTVGKASVNRGSSRSIEINILRTR